MLLTWVPWTWIHFLRMMPSAFRLRDWWYGVRLHNSRHGDGFPLFRYRHTRDTTLGTEVAIIPGTWRHRVNARTDWPGVSIL